MPKEQKTEISIEQAMKKIAEEKQKRLKEFQEKFDALCAEYGVRVESFIQARII